MSDPVVLLSTGDVVGPAGSVTDNSMVLFSGTSGKLIKGNNAVVTAAGLALLDDVNAAAQRTTLGLGTAATANVTTGTTDTTAGRLMKVGDFGLGSAATPVIANIDAFSTPSGFYKFTDGTGTKPVGGGAYAYVLINNWNGVTLTQTWIPYGVAQMFVRTATDNNTWGAWREIALTDSPAFTGIPAAPTASVGTGTDQIATTAFVQAQLASSVPAATDTVAGKVELATNAETQAGTDTTRAVTPANLNSTVLGMGQTWQNMTASRVKGTTYTNTTGRPIQILVQYQDIGDYIGATFTVGSLTRTTGDLGGSSSYPYWFSAVIPNGNTYSISGGVSLPAWWELR